MNKLIGVTPVLKTWRGEEIKKFIKDWNKEYIKEVIEIENMIILDDLGPSSFIGLDHRLVMTDFLGLNKGDIAKAIILLGI